MIIGENTNKVYFFKGFQVGFHLGALNTLGILEKKF